MKQILASIAIMALLIFFSISDFKMPIFSDTEPDWDASQDQIHLMCEPIELPRWCMIGTDGTCQVCGEYMLKILRVNNYPCIYITNEGWIPTSRNPVSLKWAKVLAQGY